MTEETRTWDAERLIEFAQNMDRAEQSSTDESPINRRKLAFDARKLARTKIRNRGD